MPLQRSQKRRSRRLVERRAHGVSATSAEREPGSLDVQHVPIIGRAQLSDVRTLTVTRAGLSAPMSRWRGCWSVITSTSDVLAGPSVSSPTWTASLTVRASAVTLVGRTMWASSSDPGAVLP
jgi:hypothetical protein